MSYPPEERFTVLPVQPPVRFGQTEFSRFLPLARLGPAAGRFLSPPGAVHLLHGHSSVYTAALLFACASRGPVAVIDGSMRFNSYIISRLASFLGLPPKEALGRIRVTRSFTAFQTEAAATAKLPRLLDRVPCPLVVVTGLLDTYYDEQVRPAECRESLGRILRTFAELARRGTHVLIADVDVGSAAPPGKGNLFGLLRRGAGDILLLEHDGENFRLGQEERPLPEGDREPDPRAIPGPDSGPDRHPGRGKSLIPWDATTTPSR